MFSNFLCTDINECEKTPNICSGRYVICTQMVQMNATAKKVITTRVMDVKISMNATLVFTSVMKQPQNVKTQLEDISACVEPVSTRRKINVLVSFQFILLK